MPRVDKIVGPGNAYVADAKRQVFGQVGIDMIAGPSEILVIGDGSTPADWVAMDLFSQAEHDESAQAILLSPRAAYLDAVRGEHRRSCCRRCPAQDDHRASLDGARRADPDAEPRRGLRDRRTASRPSTWSSRWTNPDALLPKLRHAGAIFLGRWSSEAIGDYCAGPNHVLPTAGTARFSSPLGVYDFQKRTQRDRRVAGRRATRSGGWPPRSPTAKDCGAHARRGKDEAQSERPDRR